MCPEQLKKKKKPENETKRSKVMWVCKISKPFGLTAVCGGAFHQERARKTMTTRFVLTFHKNDKLTNLCLCFFAVGTKGIRVSTQPLQTMASRTPWVVSRSTTPPRLPSPEMEMRRSTSATFPTTCCTVKRHWPGLWPRWTWTRDRPWTKRTRCRLDQLPGWRLFDQRTSETRPETVRGW